MQSKPNMSAQFSSLSYAYASAAEHRDMRVKTWKANGVVGFFVSFFFIVLVKCDVS